MTDGTQSLEMWLWPQRNECFHRTCEQDGGSKSP